MDITLKIPFRVLVLRHLFRVHLIGIREYYAFKYVCEYIYIYIYTLPQSGVV